MGWIETADRAVFEALCAVFGLSPDSKEASRRFRAAYLHEATNPPTDRTKDVCYYAISEQTTANLDSIEISYQADAEGMKAVLRKVIPVQCLFSFYGSNSDNDAEKLWSLMYLDSGSGCARSILRQANMVPVPRPNRPLSVPELEGSLWRRRCDLTILFSLLDETSVPVAQVKSAPDIEIQTNR